MNTFETYLKQQNHSKTSIIHYLYQIKDYLKWCKTRKEKPNQIDYKTFLKYIKYLQRKQWKAESVNNQIRAVKYYYDYLINQNEVVENPAEQVKVKREVTKVLTNLLSNDELEDLYYSYKTQNINDYYFTAVAKRNKVITGLIVYQALNNTSLHRLKLEHLELYKGKIYVPRTAKSNQRTLELKSWQVIELMEYINEYRPKIQKHINLYNDAIFPTNCSHFGTIVNTLIKNLRYINQKVKNINQLRASVITIWLAKNNIREVQQMAGHRYIGSTEKYVQDNLENLQEAISTFHPMSY